MDITEIRRLCTSETIEVTQHMTMRFRERGVKLSDIKRAIMSGTIIEDYPDAYPYPACLVLGSIVENKPLHVVCGIGDNKLWIISAYRPDISRWNEDLKTRKEI